MENLEEATEARPPRKAPSSEAQRVLAQWWSAYIGEPIEPSTLQESGAIWAWLRASICRSRERRHRIFQETREGVVDFKRRCKWLTPETAPDDPFDVVGVVKYVARVRAGERLNEGFGTTLALVARLGSADSEDPPDPDQLEAEADRIARARILAGADPFTVADWRRWSDRRLLREIDEIERSTGQVIYMG